jgi:hypothetical protein
MEEEERLRELAGALRTELPDVIDDDDERQAAAAELDAALALPEGQARDELLATLRRRPATRRWAADRTGAAEVDVTRSVTGLAGSTTQPLGVHVVCPEGDYDRYLESPTEDPGRCPKHGRKLVRAGD